MRLHPVLLAGLILSGMAHLVKADSDPAHRAAESERPRAWPEGIIPCALSRLSPEEQSVARLAMQRWMDTGARVAFVPRTSQSAYVEFTGRTDAGNNTSQTGFKPKTRVEINITAFWWRQGEWMPAHELGHVLGFHHEQARWDRDQYVAIHYEHIKAGRSADYDWIPQTNWLVTTTAYDYYSIMHYRVCWASSCESECHDGDGSSPCAVIAPLDTKWDRVIGQWSQNGISATDRERARLAYGIGQTIYVKPGATEQGSGTLADPYGSLARARRGAPNHSRFVVLNENGTFTCKE